MQYNPTPGKRSGKWKRRILALMIALPLYTACSATWLNLSGQVRSSDWRTSSREPAGLAPDPATTPEAVVQVYAARPGGAAISACIPGSR